jgi:hypothetical protein
MPRQLRASASAARAIHHTHGAMSIRRVHLAAIHSDDELPNEPRLCQM